MQISLEIGGLDHVSGANEKINVPSKGDGVSLWRVKASQIGTARLLAKALTNEESDALELTLPVEPVGVPRTINGVGTISEKSGEGKVLVNFPANTDGAAHSLHVEISPSIAGSLFSALDYLTSYPYGCTEQTMSSFLPNVIVAETLKKLNLPSRINPSDLDAMVHAGLARLSDYQHDDGGWGWWKEDESRVFMSAYVVGGLAEAKRTYPPDPQSRQMLAKGIGYLRRQLADHPRMIPDLRAYVIYALSEAGEQNLGDSLNTLMVAARGSFRGGFVDDWPRHVEGRR